MSTRSKYRNIPCIILSIVPCSKRVQDYQRKYKILFMFTDLVTKQVKIYSGTTQSYLHSYVTNKQNGYSPMKAKLSFDITCKNRCLIFNDIEME